MYSHIETTIILYYKPVADPVRSDESVAPPIALSIMLRSTDRIYCVACFSAEYAITGCIARNAKWQCLSSSEGDFEVIRPAGATRYTDEGEIWHEAVCHSHRFTHPRQISSHRCRDAYGPPKWKFNKFYQISEYERHTGAYPSRNFRKISGLYAISTRVSC